MDLLPSSIINNGIDAYLTNHLTNSKKIYWSVMGAVSATILSLPFIYVDISIQDTGIIRPATEKTEIKAIVTEFVDSIYVKEGDLVKIGDTILTQRSSSQDYQINYQRKRLNDLQTHINDLQYLVKGLKPNHFSSNTRLKEYNFYTKQTYEYETSLQKADNDYQRHKQLFEKNVVSEEEFEKYQYEIKKVYNELASLKENQISKWQTDLNTYINSYNEILTSMKQEVKNKDLYIITSPVNGTLDQFRGIYKGSNIQAGNTLAIISPNSTLFVEVYVSPRNIGYIYEEMAVQTQIQSFNYNEWGTIPGKVKEISSDFFTDNTTGNTFYKVKCNLDKTSLIRKNGIKGNLKKGMTVYCHFMITRRSLLDLIYQNVDDWINPTQYNNRNKKNPIL
ncbi:MAG: HlyD family secretion protein [Macellibacteroides fermentans]|uniref:HlyD family secretion protein n=1 Tax=Macellibacteroides fermentans TaxID=879969 RepID=UPI003ACBE235